MLRVCLTATALATSASALQVSQKLGSVPVTRLADGRIATGTAPVALSSLWQDRGAVIFAVRRPG